MPRFSKLSTSIVAAAEMAEEAARLKGLRERLRTGLASRVPGLLVNGDLDHRLPGSLNVSVPGTTAPAMIEACPSIAISTGSACTSASVEPSYVLRALGLSDDRANASIRLGLGLCGRRHCCGGGAVAPRDHGEIKRQRTYIANTSRLTATVAAAI